MFWLNFYINRAGRKLPEKQLAKLEAEKDELRGIKKNFAALPILKYDCQSFSTCISLIKDLNVT